MAEKEFTRQLDAVQIEELGYLVAQANAVALLIHTDVGNEDTAKDAAGAITMCLDKARAILDAKPEALACFRAANGVNDSPLLTLLAATQDRVGAIARHLGIEDQLDGAEVAEAREAA